MFEGMKYWLVKSEPKVYDWERFVKDGHAIWDGVRNYAARNNLRAMQKGDLVLWYHSNEGKEIVGIARVTKTAFPDKTAVEGDWSAVELKPHKKLKRNVTLAAIKSDRKLANMELIKLSRLSVSVVKPAEFDHIILMSEST